MRPINKGETPGEFADYEECLRHLEDRLGAYCSYCELHVTNSLAVEHVIPKDPVPALANNWANLLLTCTNCNSCKNIKQLLNAQAYFCPDEVNTAHLFGVDLDSNKITIKTENPVEYILAEASINMLGLNHNDESRRNLRNRRNAINDAREKLEEWLYIYQDANVNTQLIGRRTLVNHAKQCGFLTVWLTVFADYPEICQALIAAFPGTRVACYDPANGYRPVQQLNLIP